MNILQITNSLHVGGAERLLTDFIPKLKRKHCVELLVLQHCKSPFMDYVCDCGVKVHCLEVRSLYSLSAILKIRRFLKNNPQFDVVHVHLFPSLYWTAIASIGLRKKLVWTEHNTFNKRRNKWYMRFVEKYIYSQYNKIVCISKATLLSLTGWIGGKTNSTKFAVIENGVDIEKFERIDIEHRYPHTLIMVSRFELAKDQDTLLRAMQHLDSDVHTIFVGDGSRLDYCKSLSCQLGINDRVHFLGSRTDIRQLLSIADIAVQSSHWEGFGLTAVEAMANGLPMIASNVDGLKQVVEDVGILFEKGDDVALANAINVLLDDKILYENMSKRSLQRAKMYSINNMTDRYIRLYESLV